MKKSDLTGAADAKAAPAKPEPDRKVRLDPKQADGRLSCGAYAVGQVYTVKAAEAKRLVDHKRFSYVEG